MSISLGHRAIFSAFGHRNVTAPHAPASSQATPAVAIPLATEAGGAVEAGQLTCSPWEGLYLDQAVPFTASPAEEAASERQLDAFLASLMYGE